MSALHDCIAPALGIASLPALFVASTSSRDGGLMTALRATPWMWTAGRGAPTPVTAPTDAATGTGTFKLALAAPMILSIPACPCTGAALLAGRGGGVAEDTGVAGAPREPKPTLGDRATTPPGRGSALLGPRGDNSGPAALGGGAAEALPPSASLPCGLVLLDDEPAGSIRRPPRVTDLPSRPHRACK